MNSTHSGRTRIGIKGRLHKYHPRRARRAAVFEANARVDEALWSAYRRSDKSAVTSALLQRYFQPPRKQRLTRRQLSHG